MSAYHITIESIGAGNIVVEIDGLLDGSAMRWRGRVTGHGQAARPIDCADLDDLVWGLREQLREMAASLLIPVREWELDIEATGRRGQPRRRYAELGAALSAMARCIDPQWVAAPRQREKELSDA